MKILFFTSSIEDYLADPTLQGLRLLYGKDCIDYPKCEILYKNCPEQIRKQVRGNGFTLYTMDWIKTQASVELAKRILKETKHFNGKS